MPPPSPRRVGSSPVPEPERLWASSSSAGCSAFASGASSRAGGSPECSSTIFSAALARLGHQLGRPEHAGVLAEAEHPGDEQARDRVLRAVHAPAVLALAHLAVGAERALDLPGDVVRHPDRRRTERGRRAATGCGSRTRADRSPRGAGSRARPWSSRRPCPGRARAGTRGSRRARASGRRGRTARPRTAAGTGSTLRSSVRPVCIVKYSNSIRLRRWIAVSTFASRLDSSAPPADAVIPRPIERWAGVSSGLGRPQAICWSASRSGSAYANSPSSRLSAVCSAASSESVNSIGGRWKAPRASE